MSDRLVLIYLPFAALLLVSVSGCSDSHDFKCGTPLPSDEGVVRTCGRPHEVCVCESNSCARRVDAAACESGLRYVEEPFAAPGLASRCVTQGQGWLIDESASDRLCSARPPADAGVDSPPGDSGAQLDSAVQD